MKLRNWFSTRWFTSSKDASASSPSSRPQVEPLEERCLLTNAQYVNAVYQVLLGRPAEPFGLNLFTGQLNSGFVSRFQVVLAIENSGEYRADEVQALYLGLLHRPADSAALQTDTQFLSQGGSLEDLRNMIMGTSEYFATRGNNDNSTFLRAVFQDLFGRPVDSNNAFILGRALGSGIPHTLLVQLLSQSAEEKIHRAESLFETYLHRPGDPFGLGAFAGALQQGVHDEVVIAVMLGSPEFSTNIGV